MITLENARDLILNQIEAKKTASKNIEDIADMVLAEDIFADRDYPPFNRATMDGYAVCSENIKSNVPVKFNLIGEQFAGQDSSFNINNGQCVRIMTGAVVPDGADAVVKIEDTKSIGNEIEITTKNPFSGLNIAKKAEDIKQNDLLISKGTVCNHFTTGMLISVGKQNALVYKKPVVSVLGTGDELRKPGDNILPHQIRDSNTWMIRHMLGTLGIIPEKSAIVPDDPVELNIQIKAGLNSDVLILSGGVSMGSADYVPEILEKLGVKKIFHKASIKPGKPIWFGKTRPGNLVFGLPGNPFAVQVTMAVFVLPALRKLFGKPTLPYLNLPLMASHKKKTSGRTEILACKLGSELNVEPLSNNGSGDLRAGQNSDGLCIIPKDISELNQGELVEFLPWKEWRCT